MQVTFKFALDFYDKSVQSLFKCQKVEQRERVVERSACCHQNPEKLVPLGRQVREYRNGEMRTTREKSREADMRADVGKIDLKRAE